MTEEPDNSLTPFQQKHLLDFWNELDEHQRESLAAEIRDVDFDQVARLYRDYRRKSGAQDVLALAERAGAVPSFRLGDHQNPFPPDEARRRGAEALRSGHVGVCLVAGGQGTRLGFPHPKGMYAIGPVSNSCLFRIFIERIRATSDRFGAPVPLYLMTSPVTHDETIRFLADQRRFGLPDDDLTVFCQGTMPAVDAGTGKVLLADRRRLALSPDGHGGTVAALDRAGCFDDMRRRGIRHLFYLQVDNPLVQICLPEFLGYHLLSRSEMSTQVIAKETPFDRVGNVVEADGRLHVIEYSDLPPRVAEQRNADGSLLLRLGSLGVHVMDVAFLERMAAAADSLPFHVAHKKVPFVDPGGEKVSPKKPNALKFERFIFDLMPSAENAIVLEVSAPEHFAPLKNASRRGCIAGLLRAFGLIEEQDTPQMVRAQMVALHTEWLRRAGAKVARRAPVEISPLFALNADDLAGKIPPGTRVTKPTYFYPDDQNQAIPES
jgi:UDP-N-acetylglucosamine/UDP-N-acetylgalactosamine diphosphorylase